MSNEEVLDTNKLTKSEEVSKSDDEIIRQLSESLQDISPEDVDTMCDAIDEEKKRAEKIKSILDEMNKLKIEEKVNNLDGDEFIELLGTLGI